MSQEQFDAIQKQFEEMRGMLVEIKEHINVIAARVENLEINLLSPGERLRR